MCHLTQSKQGMSSLELARRLGITQNAAWKMKHKLAQIMLERNATKRLKGRVQMDDAYLGGERPGRHGRGAAGKTPFVAAVETTDEGKPHQIILIRAHGMAPATLRRHFASRVVAGLVIRRDSPGKRYARRGQGGEIENAFVFDLTLLVARAAEIENLAEEVRTENKALALLRERITLALSG